MTNEAAAPTYLRDKILSLTSTRGPAMSICPSEVARAVVGEDGDWRALMPAVRRAAGELAREGLVVVTRGGVVVDAESGGGPIRIAIAGDGSEDEAGDGS